jgi:hypothetical protein
MVAMTTIIGSREASAASILNNGEFLGTLAPWTIQGVAGNTGDTAILTDESSAAVAVFQTVAMPQEFSGFTLFFDFIDGLSPAVTEGFLLDTFFATVYIGADSFGPTIEGARFDESVDLFNLDANGVFGAAAGATIGPSPKGVGWSQFSLSRTISAGVTGPKFATVSFEFFDLNGIQNDSSVAVDNVRLIAAVPEPGAGALIGIALAAWCVRRRRNAVAVPRGHPPGRPPPERIHADIAACSCCRAVPASARRGRGVCPRTDGAAAGPRHRSDG